MELRCDKCERFSYAQLWNPYCVFYRENTPSQFVRPLSIQNVSRTKCGISKCASLESLIIQVFQGLDKKGDDIRDAI
jgi:hypothetical protein